MVIKLKHLFKKTSNGNFHIPFFQISFGKDGFMLVVLGIALIFNNIKNQEI